MIQSETVAVGRESGPIGRSISANHDSTSARLSRISFATCCRSFFVRSNHLHAYSIALKRDQCLEARSDRSTARVHALVSVENPIAAPDALHGGTDEDLDGPSDAPESKEVRERPELVADL